MKDIGTTLEAAVSKLSLAVSFSTMETSINVRHEISEISRNSIYPTAGAYPVSAGTLKPPAKVSRPTVEMEGDQLIISWDDPHNYRGSLSKYELRYDETCNSTLPVPANYTSFSLGYPKVTPGRLYTISVRAVNGRGPGEWSDHTIARFKTGPPNKPNEPLLYVDSTSVTATVEIPESDECNGAPVSEVIVEFCETDNSSQWKSERKAVDKNDDVVTLEITELPAGTVHLFRTKLVNEFGTSQPSKSLQINTQMPIPGVPT